MDTYLYTPAIVQRFQNLLYNDIKVLNSPSHLTYRMGGCSTILRLDKLNNEWKHCTSADLFGAVTSDCICEYINTVDNKQLLLSYINTAIKGDITQTNLDMVLTLPTRLQSINLILNYYKQHIEKVYE